MALKSQEKPFLLQQNSPWSPCFLQSASDRQNVFSFTSFSRVLDPVSVLDWCQVRCSVPISLFTWNLILLSHPSLTPVCFYVRKFSKDDLRLWSAFWFYLPSRTGISTNFPIMDGFLYFLEDCFIAVGDCVCVWERESECVYCVKILCLRMLKLFASLLSHSDSLHVGLPFITSILFVLIPLTSLYFSFALSWLL